tara:strand:+ start:716 stop:997 length:282 start_codon:yes stop_codon:yes gene_type:complete
MKLTITFETNKPKRKRKRRNTLWLRLQNLFKGKNKTPLKKKPPQNYFNRNYSKYKAPKTKVAVSMDGFIYDDDGDKIKGNTVSWWEKNYKNPY